MNITQAILLGIIQGLTEFLPISSSGHLVIIPHLLGWKITSQDAFSFYVLIQVASLLGIFVYFWHDLLEIGRAFIQGIRDRKPFASTYSRLGWYLLLATVPAGGIGLLLQDVIERIFSDPMFIGFFLWITAFLLFLAEYRKGKRTLDNMTWWDALWIGCFQVISLLPGVSRSGAAMSGGMTRNLDRPSAARFSFLMAIPVMLAAGLLASLKLSQSSYLANELPIFAAGFFTSAVVSYLSIRWLLNYLKRNSLLPFAFYCLLMGFFSILTFLF